MLNARKKQFHSFLSVVLIIFLSLFFISSANADTSSKSAFTPEQQTEMQTAIHDYIVNNPEVLIEAGRAYQQKQFEAMQAQIKQAVSENSQSLLNSKTSPVVGDANASVTVIEFYDYQCGHCKKMNLTMKKIIQDNPKVRFIFKEYPIFGGTSEIAARGALAASSQGKFLSMHDELLTQKTPYTQDDIMTIAKSLNLNTKKIETDMNSKSVSDEIDNNLELGQKLGIQGTLTFIIMNAKEVNQNMTINEIVMIPGEIPQDNFQNILNKIEKSDQ